MKNRIAFLLQGTLLCTSCCVAALPAPAPSIVPDTCHGMLTLYFSDSLSSPGHAVQTLAMTPIPLYEPGAAEPFDSLRFTLRHYTLSDPQFGEDVVFDGNCYEVSTGCGTLLDPFVFIQGPQAAAIALGNEHIRKMASENSWSRTHIFPGPIHRVSFKVYGELQGDWLYVILDRATGRGAYVRYDEGRMQTDPWVAPSPNETIYFNGNPLRDKPGGELRDLPYMDKRGLVVSVQGDWLEVLIGRDNESLRGWVRWKDKDGPVEGVLVLRAIQ